MHNVTTALEAARTALATLAGVTTCKIGIETNMTPADYPIIRIVPTKLGRGDTFGGERRIDAMIYFGKPIHEFDAGLESLYAELHAMEVAIIDKLEAQNDGFSATYIETFADEDRIEAYKLYAIRAVILG